MMNEVEKKIFCDKLNMALNGQFYTIELLKHMYRDEPEVLNYLTKQPWNSQL